MRLFLALELPEAARDALHRWASGLALPCLRCVGAESLHVTVCFIGERPDPEPVRAGVADVLDGVARGADPLAIIGFRWLPRRRPRVLAAELSDPGERLAALSAALHDRLGVPGAHRRFLPHVTVGRVRAGVGAPGNITAPPVVRFPPGPVVLLRSHLGDGPARYERLAAWPIR